MLGLPLIDSATGNPVDFATEVEATALTAPDKIISPATLGAVISGLGAGSVPDFATDAQSRAMTATDVTLSPSSLAAVLAANVQTFTTNGTWTKPAQGRIACIQMWGAGGSGARRSSGNGAGGGSGFYMEIWKLLSELGATETVAIGAGGAAQLTDNTDGLQGGPTSFGSHLTLYGGRGGQQAASGTIAIGGGSGHFADFAGLGLAQNAGFITGQSTGLNLVQGLTTSHMNAAASTGASPANTVQTPGTNSYFGPAGGSGHSTAGAVRGAKNLSVLAGDGGQGNHAGDGEDGQAPGGGGGSGTTKGGKGGDGQVTVTVF